MRARNHVWLQLGEDGARGGPLLIGERVRRVPTGEEGVILRTGNGALLQVAFPSGSVWIHHEELEKLPEDPAELLAGRHVGRAEPYGLRLQALYLKHAYRVGGGSLSLDATAAFKDLKGVAGFYIWPMEKRPPLERGRAALHAKAAIADDHTALVTSANLTGHAIASNMELGLLIRGGPVPRRLAAHFQQLLSDRIMEEVLA